LSRLLISERERHLLGEQNTQSAPGSSSAGGRPRVRSEADPERGDGRDQRVGGSARRDRVVERGDRPIRQRDRGSVPGAAGRLAAVQLVGEDFLVGLDRQRGAAGPQLAPGAGVVLDHRGRAGPPVDALRPHRRSTEDARPDRQGLRVTREPDPPDRVQDLVGAAPPLALPDAARPPRLIRALEDLVDDVEDLVKDLDQITAPKGHRAASTTPKRAVEAKQARRRPSLSTGSTRAAHRVRAANAARSTARRVINSTLR